MKYILFTLFLFSYQSIFAWGGRGHDVICESATHLVQNKELKLFLKTRTHIMGHLCNIPDTSWRSLSSQANSEGAPAHYIDADILPVPVSDIPLDLKQIVDTYTGKKKSGKDQNIKSIPHELGTLWWRADQFYRLAITQKTAFQKIPKIEKGQEQEESNDFNRATYNFFVNLGVMGHFVGDAAQPFHNTDDYDGYGKGHGGIHSYYEETAVSNLDETLQSQVVAEAKKLIKNSKKVKFLSDKTVLEKMRSISSVASKDIDLVLKADLIKKPSDIKEERGMKMKIVAERLSIEKTLPQFKPLIIKHMANAAALLASIWDQAYDEVGNPNLAQYRSFKYPFQPEFVMPDYYTIQEDAKK